ncbi:cobyric acid synthase [Paenibacillus sp. M1]|uniref:Cobyric acid synthase n=1 Tax=Paenibacillus haidiansis TaxID=1574488 RepID=A0ABU7VTC3_9BACL
MNEIPRLERKHEDGAQGAVLMVQGTASDVGKSILVTALCRIFTQDGYLTAPFKSQNMALNSYVTPDGKEIGRAQGIQAEACGIAATTDMNPVLLKPTGEMHSQVIVHGKPYRDLSAAGYREGFLPMAKPLVMEALGRLRQTHDIVVMEGAGSPAEINLKHRDIVNMNLAGWADAPVILVGDIDRGGVFAFLVGTLELLEPEERARVKGFIINKFRGDISLLKPGLDWLEQRTGIPVLGVVPYMPDLNIEAEDSVALDGFQSRMAAGKDLDIAVIRYPLISNFTDFDILAAEPDVSLRYIQHPSQLGDPDIIILPGSKNTIGDLEYVRRQGLDEAIREAMERRSHTRLAGICGGYQMLGREMHDPEAVESPAPRHAEGLGWLPLETTFIPGKTTIRVSGTTAAGQSVLIPGSKTGYPIRGYEIHAGRTVACGKTEAGADLEAEVIPLFRIHEEGGAERPEGCTRPDGRVFGTYLHGLFQNNEWRRAWLNRVRMDKGLPPLENELSAESRKEEAFNKLADHVRTHLDIPRIYNIMKKAPL